MLYCLNEMVLLGWTWFSCSLYSFYSKQAEQKSSALEQLYWCTPAYSVFRSGVGRTVTWSVPKQDGGALPACTESHDLHRSTSKHTVLLVLGGCSGVLWVLSIHQIKSAPEHSKQMFKLMDDKIFTNLLSKFLLSWTYDQLYVNWHY